MTGASAMLAGALLATLAGCPRPSRSGAASATDVGGPFSVSIEQSGRTVPVSSGTARLRQAPFAILVTLPAEATSIRLMVHASRSPRMWEAVRSGRSAGSVLPLARRGFEEPLGNTGRDVVVADDGYSFWYYLNPGVHKFDLVTSAGGRIRCRRTIEACRPGEAAAPVPVAQLDAPALYFTFVGVTWNADRTARVERGARSVALRFSR